MSQKMRSLLTLVGLLALAGGVTLYAYFGVHKKQEAEKAQKEQSEKLFDFDKAKVKGLAVTAKGGTTLLSRSQDGWDVVSPIQAPADKATVDGIVDRLLSLKSKSLVEEKSANLAKFGLDKPALKVVVQLDGAGEVALRGGTENPFDNSLYAARNESNDVLQVENFKYSVEKDTFDLRDKRVVVFEDEKLRELSVAVDGARWAIKKVGGQWSMSAPFADRADEQTVQKVLSALHNLRATRFATDLYTPAAEGQYGFRQPRLEATFSLDGGGQINLIAGQADEAGGKKSFARRKEAAIVAEVPDSIFTDLAVKPMELRDKTVFAFDRNQVQGARFGFGAEAVALEKVKAGDAGGVEDWKITGPTPGAAKKGKVGSLLWSLGSLKAVSFVEDNPSDLARYGLDKPSRTVALLGEGGKELGTLAIGKEEASNVYVMSSASKRVLEVEKSKIADLPSGRADLEEAPQTPVAAPPAAPEPGKP